MPKATVILSVYNRLDFLELVLAGFEMQAERDFEIIVSDDGSGPAFVDGLQKIVAASSLRIRHSWHADAGFRKNKILNASLQMAAADYLIFVDGDCIPHPQFVAEHLANAEANTCLNGRRVDLSPGITDCLSPAGVRAGALQSLRLHVRMIADYLAGRLAQLKNGWYLKSALLRHFFNRQERGILGANFSVPKAAMMAINGFDERYDAPTFGEDSDVEFRLRLNGVKFKTVLNMAVAYHCWHKLLPRPQSSKALYESVLKAGVAYTPYGINKAI